METLAPTIQLEDMVMEYVAPSTSSDSVGPLESILGFLVQKVPISTLLSMEQSNF